MTLGFKRMFGPFVWEGSKRHTLRAGSRWRVGMTCHCFIDPRQKGMARLGDWECIRVETVRVLGLGLNLRIRIEGVELKADERNAFAWQDGFRSRGLEHAWVEFCEFWRREHGKVGTESGKPVYVNFYGQLVHWKFSEATRAPRPAQLAVAA